MSSIDFKFNHARLFSQGNHKLAHFERKSIHGFQKNSNPPANDMDRALMYCHLRKNTISCDIKRSILKKLSQENNRKFEATLDVLSLRCHSPGIIALLFTKYLLKLCYIEKMYITARSIGSARLDYGIIINNKNAESLDFIYVLACNLTHCEKKYSVQTDIPFTIYSTQLH